MWGHTCCVRNNPLKTYQKLGHISHQIIFINKIRYYTHTQYIKLHITILNGTKTPFKCFLFIWCFVHNFYDTLEWFSAQIQNQFKYFYLKKITLLQALTTKIIFNIFHTIPSIIYRFTSYFGKKIFFLSLVSLAVSL